MSEPTPGRKETKLGKPLRLHAMLPLAQSESLAFTEAGAELEIDPTEAPNCRLLVILLVVSSLRISNSS